jgi:hypothetical protein
MEYLEQFEPEKCYYYGEIIRFLNPLILSGSTRIATIIKQITNNITNTENKKRSFAKIIIKKPDNIAKEIERSNIIRLIFSLIFITPSLKSYNFLEILELIELLGHENKKNAYNNS